MSFELKGRGWGEACDDIVLPGLGWVAVTGVGDVKVRALIAGIEVTDKEKQLDAKEAEANSVQKEEEKAREAREERVLPFAREPLMPLDARKSMRKFHGSDTRQNRRMVGTAAQKMQQRGFHTLSTPTRMQTPYSIFTVISASLRGCSTTFSRSSSSSAVSSPVDTTATVTDSSTSAPIAHLPSSASSSTPPSPATSASSVPRRSLSSYGRPQWNVYKQLLVAQSTSIQRAYRNTAEYVKAPKGSWRVQHDGRLVKLFRWRVKWGKGGQFRKRIDTRRQEKQQRAAEAAESGWGGCVGRWKAGRRGR